MLDIALNTQQFQPEDLSWDRTPPEGGFVLSGTLDLTKFIAGELYPNGFIPSGTVLGKLTSGGLYAPYLATASDGTQTAVGILRQTVQVLQPNGVARAKVGISMLIHGVVEVAKLPNNSSNQSHGGYLDSAAQTALKLIYFR